MKILKDDENEKKNEILQNISNKTNSNKKMDQILNKNK